MKLKLTVLAIAAAALIVPAAYATKPATHPTHPTTPASTNATHPTVMFVLHGTITGTYVAPTSTANGSVTLLIKSSNHHAALLDGKTITFIVGTSSNVVGTPTSGHNATLKWRGTKAPSGTAPAAPTGAVVQLIDQGSPA